jgi:hypothetical protein
MLHLSQARLAYALDSLRSNVEKRRACGVASASDEPCHQNRHPGSVAAWKRMRPEPCHSFDVGHSGVCWGNVTRLVALPL